MFSVEGRSSNYELRRLSVESPEAARAQQLAKNSVISLNSVDPEKSNTPEAARAQQLALSRILQIVILFNST